MSVYKNMFLGELKEKFTVIGEIPKIINSFIGYEGSYISNAYLSGKKLYGDLHMNESKQQYKFVQILCVPASGDTVSIRSFSFKKEETAFFHYNFSRGRILRNRLEI